MVPGMIAAPLYPPLLSVGAGVGTGTVTRSSTYFQRVTEAEVLEGEGREW